MILLILFNMTFYLKNYYHLLKVAILIAYRNRWEHLKIFLRYMHPLLQRQQLHYRIFIIEQVTLGRKCPYSELFWPAFSRIRTEYGEIRSISLYSVRMWKNADQNNFEYGHFSGSITYFNWHITYKECAQKVRIYVLCALSLVYLWNFIDDIKFRSVVPSMLQYLLIYHSPCIHSSLITYL